MNEQNNQNQNTYSRSSAINIDNNEIRMLKKFWKKMKNINYIKQYEKLDEFPPLKNQQFITSRPVSR